MKKQITINPDQSKSYHSASKALEDNGFFFMGEYRGPVNPVNHKAKKYEIYRKDFVEYYLHGMEHYNTTIYKIVVKVLPYPLGHYDPMG